MLKRRVLSFVLSAFFTLCSGVVPAFASGLLIDDMEIDPAGDLEDYEAWDPPAPTDPVFDDPFVLQPSLTPDVLGTSVYTEGYEPGIIDPNISFFTTAAYGSYTHSGVLPYVNYQATDTSVSTLKQFMLSGYTYSVIDNVSEGGYQLNAENTLVLGVPTDSGILGVSLNTENPYFDFSGSCFTFNQDSADADTLVLGGKFEFRFTSRMVVTYSGGNKSTYYAPIYPIGLQLLVDGKPLGDIVPIEYDSSTISGWSTSIQPKWLSVPLDLTVYGVDARPELLGFRLYVDSVSGTQSFNPNMNTVATISSINRLFVGYNENLVVDYVLSEEDETVGLLEGVVGWLRNIWDSISGLPERIGNFLLDGLKSLFVPSEEDITEIKQKYESLLEERLGFAYDAYIMLDEATTTIKEGFEGGEGYTFTFPGISFPMNGETITIMEEQEISLDNAIMDVLRPMLGTIVCFFSVYGVIRTGSDMVVAVISGVSPFAFYQARKELRSDHDN